MNWCVVFVSVVFLSAPSRVTYYIYSAPANSFSPTPDRQATNFHPLFPSDHSSNLACHCGSLSSISTVVYRHKGISAANAKEARILMDMPSKSDINAHLEDCDKGRQALALDPIYLKVMQDEVTGQFSFPKEKAGHDAVLE